MRPTLFLSTLFAVSLFGGAALAESPMQSRPTREPRAIENLRHRGDVLDKSYRGAERLRVAETRSQIVSGTRVSPIRERMNARAYCSDTGTDCNLVVAAQRGPAAQVVGSSMARSSAARSPVDKQKEQRANCGAGDECSAPNKMAVSGRGASGYGGGGLSASGGGSTVSRGSTTDKAGPALARPNMASSRLGSQPYAARMQCNEGEECSFSSKEAKKIWSYEAVKKGTWKGPSAADAAREKQEQARRERDAKK